MKNVLITGGAGYLGNIIVRKLLDAQHSVTILDTLTYGNSSVSNLKRHKNFRIINGDVRNLQVVLDSIEEKDAVIHLAGIVGDPASASDPQRALETNFLSTKMLVDCCKYLSINKFIFASTCSVYGKSKNKIVNENSELNPVSIYAEQKIRSEKYILQNKGKKFSPLIFRMGTLFGLSNRMRFDLVINRFAALAANNQTIFIEGGQQWRPFVHVSDAANAYLLALEKTKSNPELLNLGSDELNEKIINIGYMVKDLVPKSKLKIKKAIDERNYRVNFSRIKKSLKFEAKMSIQDGLNEIIKACKNNQFKNWKSDKYNNNSYLRNNKRLLKQYYFS